MIQGKNEKRYTSARVYIVLKAAIPLVLQSDGISRSSARISTKLCMILYIGTVLTFARICSRDSDFKLEIIDVTFCSWFSVLKVVRYKSCSSSLYRV